MSDTLVNKLEVVPETVCVFLCHCGFLCFDNSSLSLSLRFCPLFVSILHVFMLNLLLCSFVHIFILYLILSTYIKCP